MSEFLFNVVIGLQILAVGLAVSVIFLRVVMPGVWGRLVERARTVRHRFIHHSPT